MDQYRMIESKDLSGFLVGILRVIKKTTRYIILSLREFYLTTFLVFVLVLGIGVYFWYNTKLLYRSEMVCEFNNLSKKTYGEMVQKLDRLAKTKSYNALAYYLHLPYDDAKEIVSIEGRNMEGSLLNEDISATRAPMYFNVVATDNKVFIPLEKALLNYLNSNSPFRLQRNIMETERISKKLEYLKTDIALVDSSIKAYIGLFNNINIKADTSYRSSLTNLLNYKKGLEDELLAQEWRAGELKFSVELLYGFTPADFASRDKNKTLINAIGIAFFLAILSAILRKALREVIL